MAEHVTHGPAEIGAEMDYREHERTYSAFIKASQVLTVATLDVVLALVLFAFGSASVGFWLGSLLLVMTIVAAGMGLASRGSWKPPAVVFAIGLLFIILAVA